MNLVIMITGSQGSGKSTMAKLLAELCEREKISYRILDGKNNPVIGFPGGFNVDEHPEVTAITVQRPSD